MKRSSNRNWQPPDPANAKVRLVHAPDILEMWDKPVENAKKKPLNSMAVGLNLLKTGEGQAFISAGNTGGIMFNALRVLGRLPGVQRPALTALFPVKGGHCVVLDIGANADCRPEFLVQFAVMGSIYAEKVLGITNPRVGLLSNGEEVRQRQPVDQRYVSFVGRLRIELHWQC